MSLVVLSSTDVSEISACIPPNELINLIALVFARLTLNSGVASPLRTCISTIHHNVLFMPSHFDGFGTAVKIVSVPTSSSNNNNRGLPASTILIDDETGAAKAIVNARKLTALRNAAGSALATKLALGPSGSPRNLVMFGAGEQIEAHVDLLLRTFPQSLTTCTIFNRSMNSRLANLLSSLKRRHPSVAFIAKSTPVAAKWDSSEQEEQECRMYIGSADIICTATPSSQPLFPGHCVKSGAHVNLIGSYTPAMREIDKTLVDRAGVIIVDSKDACLKEAGDLIASGAAHEERMFEMGELIALDISSKAGEYTIVEEKCRRVRESGEITIFKSVGVGVQDTVIASLVFKYAEERNVGTRVESYDSSGANNCERDPGVHGQELGM